MYKPMVVEGEMVWVKVPEQEIADRRMMAEAVRNLPDIEPEKIAISDNGGYIGKHAELSVYDAMLAEIMGEKDARLRKYLRKHEVRHGKPVRKEKRKAYRKEKCYSCDPWHGCDTVRKFREIEAEKADARDYEIELRNIAEDAERNAIEAEIRGWELMHAVEQANARAWMAMQDWLEWA